MLCVGVPPSPFFSQFGFLGTPRLGSAKARPICVCLWLPVLAGFFLLFSSVRRPRPPSLLFVAFFLFVQEHLVLHSNLVSINMVVVVVRDGRRRRRRRRCRRRLTYSSVVKYRLSESVQSGD